MKQKECYNCRHSGDPFKIAGNTHMYCLHPKQKEEAKNNPNFNLWDTLQEFWMTCDDHELKTKPHATTNP